MGLYWGYIWVIMESMTGPRPSHLLHAEWAEVRLLHPLPDRCSFEIGPIANKLRKVQADRTGLQLGTSADLSPWQTDVVSTASQALLRFQSASVIKRSLVSCG